MSEPAVEPSPPRGSTSGGSVLGGSVQRTPPARLGVAVVSDLVSAIVTGELSPSDVLPPEGVLSQRFGVSRTVIRESVKRVEEKGLLTVAQGRGTTVNLPTMWNVLDPVVLSALVDHDDTLGVLDELSTIRASLEGSMAAAAVEHQSDRSRAELRAAFDQTEQMIHDFDLYNEADAHFHFVIMEQSQNRLAANITRILFSRARESARFTGSPGSAAMQLTLEEHRVVLEAILAGDAERASTAMSEHISQAWARRRPKNNHTGH